MPLRPHADALEALYGRYNRRGFVHPDPLEFLYDYKDPADREVVGLVAALLAYGRVAQILVSIRWVLDRLGESPSRTLRDRRPSATVAATAGFRHRFAGDEQMAALLLAVRKLLRRYGSLQQAFTDKLSASDETVLPALERWAGELNDAAGGRCGHLLSDPAKGSACKRLHLYLRWMVRRDEVDPGGWDGVGRERLVVPLDTHMHRIGRALGATDRRAADARTAEQLTAAFRRVCPDDPVRYDFALTRLGIRADTDMGEFLARCGRGETCPSG